MQKSKWLSALLALLVSFGLWVYVVTVENPVGEDTIYNVPVVFSGEDILREDYDLLITENNVTSGVSLTFSGKRSDLKKLTDAKSELYVSVDVSRIRNANEYSFVFDMSDITLPASVSANNLILENRSPNEVKLTVGKLSKVPKQVKVLANVKLLPGYMAQRVEQNFAEIVIEGPEELVDRVHYAQVLLERENVDQTITTTLPYVLIDYDGQPFKSDEITSDITEIEVTLPVVMTKEVQLEAGFIEGGGATSLDVIHEISPASITLSGDAAVLEGITSIKLPNIALADMMSNSEIMTFSIPIPEGCTNVSGETEATVDVKMPGKSIKSVRASNIQIINCPDGLNAVSKTTVVWISVRANTSQIDSITEENIRVIADLSEINLPETGSSLTIPAKIRVDNVEGAGVVGSYSVVVELTEQSETISED